jgi:hypothetical protein
MNHSQKGANLKPGIRIDHETGLIHGLPDGPQPLVGPTSGRAYEELKRNEKNHVAANRVMKRQILSNWKCIQCKRVWKGSLVRFTIRVVNGRNFEEFKCPDSKCDAPVVICETVEQIAVRQAEEKRRG